ncbi:hypothetical protein KC333_g7080 [Hortaea werneckii]|nr:hypothetical protein KC333_g7080 [Hortaea werneckii]KAI7310766.1 hypothetical protein KC326_g6563 [Hortaea werneckii]
MAFIEAKGKRHVDPSTQSKLVVEPAAYFLKHCYEPLLELFKNKTSNNVFVVCAYPASRDWWLKLFQLDMVTVNSKIGEANKATAEEKESLPGDEKNVKVPLRLMKHYADVLTMDSAQGDEALVVFVDPGTAEARMPSKALSMIRSAVMSSTLAARPLSLSIAILATTKKSRLVRCKPTRR